MKCWGANSRGQLGTGDTLNRGDEANEMGDWLIAAAWLWDPTFSPFLSPQIVLKMEPHINRSNTKEGFEVFNVERKGVVLARL